MRVAVVGLGFVGLTAALGFAEKGFQVAGYDIDENRSGQIRGGEVPFFEPGLNEALARTIGNRFIVTESAAAAVEHSECVFFCVGTPCGDDGKADLTHLLSAIHSVVREVSADCVLVIKSTIPPGTTANEIVPYLRAEGFQGAIVVNPEFLREGKCWEDFMNPDRIVVGAECADVSAEDADACAGTGAREDDTADDPGGMPGAQYEINFDLHAHAIQTLTEMYAPFHAPLCFVSWSTAEFIKYMSNSLLASLISFSNEMSLIAEAIGGVKVAEAFRILHQDRRLAGAGINSYIYPGCGYGGYCLPKDTVALSAAAKGAGFTPRILDSVISLNDEMPRLAAEKIEAAARGHATWRKALAKENVNGIKGSGNRETADKSTRIGILGLSFKPESDDVRDSSAAKIIQCLLDDGYTEIYVHDPLATEVFREHYGLPITYCMTAAQVCEACNTVAILTAWDVYRGIDKSFPGIHFVDCRYILAG